MTIPTAPGGAAGSLVTRAGQVQYGDMLLGGGTSAGWQELVGWRDAPDVDVADTPRPQAHGSYAGSVYAGSATVTFTFLLRGTPEQKAADLRTLEANTRIDGIRRALVVDDGVDGPTVRYGRVIGRTIPQDKAFQHGPLLCSVQWLCADARRYSLAAQTIIVPLAASAGGLEYPLDYPLDYGASSGGSGVVSNHGSADLPLLATLSGPLTNPVLSCPEGGWTLRFNMLLAAGETLTVDANAGTVLLGGADRLYLVAPASSPVDACLIPPGDIPVSLTASSGTGTAAITYRHVYL